MPPYDELKTEEKEENEIIYIGENANEEYLFLNNNFISPFKVNDVPYKSITHYYEA